MANGSSHTQAPTHNAYTVHGWNASVFNRGLLAAAVTHTPEPEHERHQQIKHNLIL